MLLTLDALFLCVDAADVLRQSRQFFEQNVNKAMRGGYVAGTYFDRCLRN